MKDMEIKIENFPDIKIDACASLEEYNNDVMTQKSIDVKIDKVRLEEFDTITINGVKFVKDGFKRPMLKDITNFYKGDFYIRGVKDESLHNKMFNTEAILDGYYSLPEEYLNNEIMLYSWTDDWDNECICVEVKP